jgi:hypothetical protein
MQEGVLDTDGAIARLKLDIKMQIKRSHFSYKK